MSVGINFLVEGVTVMQWGKQKDNYISVFRKSRKLKVIISKYRFFLAIGRLRININNPFITQE